MEFKTRNNLENKIKGGIFGAVLGDSLGVPVEFKRREKLKENPVREMRGYGTHHQPAGTWSDDSSMLLCLVENIIEGFSLEGLADKFVKYDDYGYMTPYDEVFDIGYTVSKAIRKIKLGISVKHCGCNDVFDNGNGSLMRILPLAFYLPNQPTKKQIKTIEDVSGITHAHEISKLACIIYVKMAMELYGGKEKNSAYLSAIDFVKTNLSEKYREYFLTFEDVLNGNIIKIQQELISSGGYVLDTLTASIWCFLNTDNYFDCVFDAINLGDDTDTTACVAGGLAGIYYGFESIYSAKPDYIEKLAKIEMLNSLVDDFALFIENK